MSDLLGLLSSLESLSKPDRQIDAEIASALKPSPIPFPDGYEIDPDNPDDLVPKEEYVTELDGAYDVWASPEVPHFTGDCLAAMRLLGRALPNWDLAIQGGENGKSVAAVFKTGNDRERAVRTEHESRAIALCIAIVRVLAGQTQGTRFRGMPSIFSIVRGRRCTVFGSAPGRVPPDGYADRVIVCANGSATGLMRAADLTVLGAQISNASKKVSRHTLRSLNGLHSDRVLFTHPGRMTDYAERFRDFGFSWNDAGILTADDRQELIERLTGYRIPELAGYRICSNGALAALLTAAAGASEVDLCGFSFDPGHFYIPGEAVRHHVEVDTVIFQWLADNANVRSTDQNMRQLFGYKAVS